jgi:MHS family proline/betaine transporter-like MFS transporter
MVAAVIGLIAAFSMRETAGNSLLQAEDLGDEPAGTARPT